MIKLKENSPDQLQRFVYDFKDFIIDNQQIKNVFDLQNSLATFDIMNTYFETPKLNSQIARYVMSK